MQQAGHVSYPSATQPGRSVVGKTQKGTFLSDRDHCSFTIDSFILSARESALQLQRQQVHLPHQTVNLYCRAAVELHTIKLYKICGDFSDIKARRSKGRHWSAKQKFALAALLFWATGNLRVFVPIIMASSRPYRNWKLCFVSTGYKQNMHGCWQTPVMHHHVNFLFTLHNRILVAYSGSQAVC